MEQENIEYLKNTFPEVITKEQFYQICHISKRTASFFLDSGIVPNTNSGKQTRKYKILLSDVIDFLEKRENDSSLNQVTKKYYRENSGKKLKTPMPQFTDEQREDMRLHFFEHLKGYKDVMSLEEVSAFTGYTTKSIYDWCSKGALKGFLINNRYKIPREYLIDFLISNRCLRILKKSEQHRRLLETIMAAI